MAIAQHLVCALIVMEKSFRRTLSVDAGVEELYCRETRDQQARKLARMRRAGQRASYSTLMLKRPPKFSGGSGKPLEP